MDIKTVIDAINAAGIVGLFIVMLWAGSKKVWVWGWAYREAIAREQEWKDLALTGTKIAEHLTHTSSHRRHGDT